jgi:hypothetical protein
MCHCKTRSRNRIYPQGHRGPLCLTPHSQLGDHLSQAIGRWWNSGVHCYCKKHDMAGILCPEHSGKLDATKEKTQGHQPTATPRHKTCRRQKPPVTTVISCWGHTGLSCSPGSGHPRWPLSPTLWPRGGGVVNHTQGPRRMHVNHRFSATPNKFSLFTSFVPRLL